MRLASKTTQTMNTSHAMAMSMLRNAAVPPGFIASPKNCPGLQVFVPGPLWACDSGNSAFASARG
jgi:hypothetical protein